MRAWELLLSGYAAGVLRLARAGLVGSGRLYLLALPAGAVTLIGVHSGLVAAGFGLLIYCGFAVATIRGGNCPRGWRIRRHFYRSRSGSVMR